MIERMVQTVKQCMKKCSAVGQDPYLAMLIYRATPLTSKIPSPAELLNGRRYRALLPERSLRQNAHDQLVEDKNKASAQYNKTANDLPSLSQEEKVYIQVDPHYNRWTQGTIAKTPLASQPRSYEVETTNGARLVRKIKTKQVHNTTKLPKIYLHYHKKRKYTFKLTLIITDGHKERLLSLFHYVLIQNVLCSRSRKSQQYPFITLTL